ncbi:MAG: Holliday junction resolvase RuvX [Myxococcales bacterium]
MSRAMGLDVGDKTVGVAVSDLLGLTAQPVTTLRRTNLEADLAALVRLCEEHEVERIVVGLPLNMNGTEGPRAALARKFAEKLRQKTGREVELWDERLSTAEVQRVLIAGDASRKKRREVVDTLAAQVILQGWMDARSARAARDLDHEENP